jgi:hypothetical protein
VNWLLAATLTLTVAQAQTQPPPPPPRDAGSSTQKGTSSIKGKVISLDGEKPLRRARITVTAPELSAPQTTSTDAAGEYEVTDLPAGRYAISVSRSGYLPLDYGQLRPGEPGKPVQLANGQKLGQVDFALPRASAVSGRITDETGEPFQGVLVWAMQPQYFRGVRRLVPVSSGGMMGGNRTDDTGQYRLLGLAPGDYVVMATSRDTWSVDEEQKQVFGYAASYHPGVVSAAEAQRVKVGVGQEVSGIDFTMLPVRAASVSGTAMMADGSPMAGANVALIQEIRGPGFSSASMGGNAKVAADGTWKLRDVSPGEYHARATSVDRDRPTEAALAMFTVSGADVDGVMLVADPGGTIAGRVVTDDGSALPPARLRVTAQAAGADQTPIGAIPAPPDNGLVAPDGTFELKAPGRPSIVRVSSLPQGWAIKGVEFNRQDYVDTALDIRGGQRIEGVSVIITRRLPAIAGRLVDERGQRADGTIVLFPADRAKWIEAAGTLRSTRPDQAGSFRFDRVRPGEYLIAALDYVQRWQVVDPEFLDEQRRRAVKVTVGESDGEPVNLVVHR